MRPSSACSLLLLGTKQGPEELLDDSCLVPVLNSNTMITGKRGDEILPVDRCLQVEEARRQHRAN